MALFNSGVGEPQELCAQGRQRRRAGRLRLQGAEPLERDTHESATDADAKQYRKGKTASELRFMGHTLSDNRHGLIASAVVTRAEGYAAREVAKVFASDAPSSDISKQIAIE